MMVWVYKWLFGFIVLFEHNQNDTITNFEKIFSFYSVDTAIL
jgi:hypothetical protein